MSGKVFSDEVIKNCVSELLPKDVIFAMGDGETVECASLWITKLQAENESMKKCLHKISKPENCGMKCTVWNSLAKICLAGLDQATSGNE